MAGTGKKEKPTVMEAEEIKKQVAAKKRRAQERRRRAESAK